MTATRADIVMTAREALGTPWHHQGRSMTRGIDCAGLVICVGQKVGLLPATYKSPPYTKTAQWNAFLLQFRDNMDEIAITDARAGDVVILRQSIFPCHCGILSENGDLPKFIHAYVKRHMVVEEGYTPIWRGLTRAAFRYRNLVEADNG